MKRVNLDTATKAVQQFVRNLPVGPEGVELTLDGQVLFKVVRPSQLSDRERDAVLARGRKLLRKVRSRNKGVSYSAIKRELDTAVEKVRGRRQR